MTDSALILCVDDEPINLTIMDELLQHRFELDAADSGAACLQRVETRRPDLILLDVNMPEMDGLETCRRLKADPDTADIPVIFVSALASQSELMAGYEAGGDDYITKPFSEAILAKKIDVVLASQRRQQKLAQISERAVEDLKDKTTVTEELGFVLRFLVQSQVHGNLEALVHQVFECLRQMRLDGSLMIVAEPENRIWFSDDIDRPMERQILESLHGQDRIVGFGTRLAVNADNATLLVRHLPGGAAENLRLRELLTILIGGLDARVQGLQSERSLARRRESVAAVLDAARASLDRIEQLCRARRERRDEILAVLGDDLESRIAGYGLETSKRVRLRKLIESARADLNEETGEEPGIEELLRQLCGRIDAALDDPS